VDFQFVFSVPIAITLEGYDESDQLYQVVQQLAQFFEENEPSRSLSSLQASPSSAASSSSPVSPASASPPETESSPATEPSKASDHTLKASFKKNSKSFNFLMKTSILD
jgi:hypothetical protein